MKKVFIIVMTWLFIGNINSEQVQQTRKNSILTGKISSKVVEQAQQKLLQNAKDLFFELLSLMKQYPNYGNWHDVVENAIKYVSQTKDIFVAIGRKGK